MSLQYIEVERKFPCANTDKVLGELQVRYRVVEHPGERQIDSYFNHPSRDFLAHDEVLEWLRVRETDGESSVTFKQYQPRDAAAQTHAAEFETNIKDAVAMKRMFKQLGFKPMIVVDKQRRTFRLEEPAVEVAFDTVADLGEFIEFEYKGQAETVDAAHQVLDEIIEPIKHLLGLQDHRGYPYLLLERLA